MSPKKQRKQNVGPIPKAYRAPQKVLKIEVINKLSGHAEELQVNRFNGKRHLISVDWSTQGTSFKM